MLANWVPIQRPNVPWSSSSVPDPPVKKSTYPFSPSLTASLDSSYSRRYLLLVGGIKEFSFCESSKEMSSFDAYEKHGWFLPIPSLIPCQMHMQSTYSLWYIHALHSNRFQERVPCTSSTKLTSQDNQSAGLVCHDLPWERLPYHSTQPT